MDVTLNVTIEKLYRCSLNKHVVQINKNTKDEQVNAHYWQ